MIQYVEEVGVQPHSPPFTEAHALEQRSIQTPLAHAWNMLVAPRVKAWIVGCALHASILERNPNCVRIPKRCDIGSLRRVGRQTRATPRDQWNCYRFVVLRHPHDAVGLAIGIIAVYSIRRNVTVIPQIPWITRSRRTILNWIFVTVLVQRFTCENPVISR